MSRLGIDRETGRIYEGKENPQYLTLPTPVVSQCKLIQRPSDLMDLPTGLDRDPFSWVFREESFDPVSRVRRGSVYQTLGGSGWESVLVDASPFSSADLAAARTNGRVMKELCVYIHCAELLNMPDRGMGMRLAIGAAGSYSTWRIMQSELTVSQDVLVTLRAESAYAILPTLDESRISPENLGSVRQAYQRVLDAAYRELPTSVVDQCRNLCVVVISRWLYQVSGDSSLLGEDLARCIAAIQRHHGQGSHMLLRSNLEVVNMLHPRGKENERHRRNLRDVSEEDASLSVQAAAFVLREIGWTL